MPQSNELRVFISSTFRDMQEQREHQMKKIFPEIRALCRERGVTCWRMGALDRSG